MEKMSFSLIIPTCHLSHLQPCLESVRRCTDLSEAEVIVVANGCHDGTEDYVKSLGAPFRLLSFAEALGYPKAINEGVKAAVKDCVVLMNDDLTVFNENWIKLLLGPLANPFIGITGPLKFKWPCGETVREAMAFWLVAMRRGLFNEIGLLDEIFTPGMGEDGDFSIRTKLAGYALMGVPDDVAYEFKEDTPVMNFPVLHQGSGTFRDVPDNGFIQRNTKILEQRYGKKIVISIVIPTFNHLEDIYIDEKATLGLKPCIESILQWSVLETNDLKVEIIPVCNGCTDGTEAYLNSLINERGLKDYVKPLYFDKPLGYPKAVNHGIRAAKGDYIVLLNNDTLITWQTWPNRWLHWMLTPFFKYPNMGITGPLVLHDGYSAHEVVIFFCAMISRKLFDKIGLLDESYGIGGGEDISFTVEAEKAGFRYMLVPEGDKINFSKLNEGSFPIFHVGEGTLSDKDYPEYGSRIIKENGLKNMLKYNRNIKLNLGSGGVGIPEYFDVDLNDKRAHILMDATDMSIFPDNCVVELAAIHLVEHISVWKIVDTFKGWLRILKPGGRLIIEVPNIMELCRHFVSSDSREWDGILSCVFGATNTTGIGDKTNVTSYHKWGWTPESLGAHLAWAGFVDIRIMPEQFPHPLYNFRVECR